MPTLRASAALQNDPNERIPQTGENRMRWFNHMLIAGSTTAVIAPPLVPVAILGSTAPDWLEWISKALGNPIEHRTTTHIVLYWAAALAVCLGHGITWESAQRSPTAASRTFWRTR